MSQVQKAPSGRVKRQPVGVRGRLNIQGKEAGYEYYIAADRPGNIAELQARGYEFVPADKVTVGDRRVSQPSAVGEKATVQLGGGEVGYVMRIPKEWYDEDQAAKLAEIRKTKDTIKRVDKKDGDYGRIKIGSESD